ncbi:MAG: alpha/beta hydrolase [Dehalococcoidia bacterium]
MSRVQQANGRVGYLFVPTGRRDPCPLMVLFHGAAQFAARSLELLQEPAAEAGVALLIPQSLDRTWDLILGGFGADVTAVEDALGWTFERLNVDPSRLASAGFSDGGSYALSLGLANGDLFTHVAGWSPGFVSAPVRHGQPPVFVSHGTQDLVLPIDRCGRRVAADLERAGYDISYREFDGPHVLPPEIAREAFRWFARGAEDSGASTR